MKTHRYLYLVFFICASLLQAHCPPFTNGECSFFKIYKEDTTQTSLQKIQKRGSLDVVILNSPTSYYKGTEKELGFEYELISAFAQDLQVDLNLSIVYTVSEALEKSREGLGDITVAGLSITQKRKDEFHFGPQYHSVQEQLICSSEMYKEKTFPRDKEDMLGLKIVVGKDTSYESTLQKLQSEVKGLKFEITSEDSTEQLLNKTHTREIDCTVADSSVFMINQRYYPKLVRALVLSERKSLAWILRAQQDSSLKDALYTWLNQYERSGKMAELRDHYFTFLSIFDYYDTSIFYKRLEKRLPKYKSYFVQAGEKYAIEWMLLAAQSYQESHWNPQATSYTGVRGMMMLTNNTAKLLGVKNRVNVKESIFGGAKYMRMLEKKLPDEIEGKNRWAFALASYNVGYGHILDAQSLAVKLNKNPHSWIDIKEVLPLLTQKKYFRKLKYGYARGNEPVKYVDAIQNYFDIIQKHDAKIKVLEREKKKLQEVNKGKLSLAFLAQTKTWIGYINMKTKKKYQLFAKERLDLDANEDWLLLFGAGSIELEANYEVKKFSSKLNMRFMYKDGKLEKIGLQKFKVLNKGKRW